MTTLDITDLFGGSRVLGATIDSDLELDAAIANGLPAEILGSFMARSGLSVGDLAPIVPTRTLMEAKTRARLTPELSDKLARVARLFSLATETLGGADKARVWMGRPNRALGGRAPIEMARRSSGALLVEQVLGRLSHGVYS